MKFSRRNGLKGQVNYRDEAANRTFVSTRITSLIIYGTHATIQGSGRVNGVIVNFRVDVDDNNHSDTFQIQWPGYLAAGAVRGEGVKIDRDDCKRDDDDDHGKDDHREQLQAVLFCLEFARGWTL